MINILLCNKFNIDYLIVYVSCSPTTQVRDIQLMVEAGYKLIKIRPVDMFPQTYHEENVALIN